MKDSDQQSSPSEPIDVDVAIVGAGLVGMPLALALSAKGWSVALLDAGGEPDEQSEVASSDEDSRSTALKQRCTALNLGTKQWLTQHGFWESVSVDACPIARVNVSHKGYFGATRLSADEMRVDALGYVVNNANYIDQLYKLCVASEVKRLYNARVNGVTQLQDAVKLSVEGACDVRTKLLVAADGITSLVRESTAISTTQVDYEQAAVLGMVELTSAHDGVAYERFTPSGPLALLPRPGEFMSFVDCINPDEQEAIDAMTDNEYLQRLQSRFGYRLGRFDKVGPRFVLPLLRIESTTQVAQRTVLVGNAMRLLHPVGGQGYNLAIRDIDSLIRTLDRASVSDPGDDALLHQFAAQRLDDQKSIVRLTDLLARGFRGNSAIPGHLRSGALLGLDAISPIRKRFAEKTMGISGL
ncbi:MAG: FAD-dependent oxidoreductase [Granulosicoccus sp.]